MAPGDRGGPSAREGACSDMERGGAPLADGAPPPRDARPVKLMVGRSHSDAQAQSLPPPTPRRRRLSSPATRAPHGGPLERLLHRQGPVSLAHLPSAAPAPGLAKSNATSPGGRCAIDLALIQQHCLARSLSCIEIINANEKPAEGEHLLRLSQPSRAR